MSSRLLYVLERGDSLLLLGAESGLRLSTGRGDGADQAEADAASGPTSVELSQRPRNLRLTSFAGGLYRARLNPMRSVWGADAFRTECHGGDYLPVKGQQRVF